MLDAWELTKSDGMMPESALVLAEAVPHYATRSIRAEEISNQPLLIWRMGMSMARKWRKAGINLAFQIRALRVMIIIALAKKARP